LLKSIPHLSNNLFSILNTCIEREAIRRSLISW
jgi:hypothetical protein